MTTTPDNSPPIPYTYSQVPIDLGSGRTSSVRVRSDVVSYFNVPAGATTATPVLKTRDGYTYTRKSGLDDTTGTPVTVSRAEWYDIPTGSKRGGGKVCRIPTELKTAKGATRYITLRFPSAATNLAISNWIAENFTSKTPSEFITSAGQRYPVTNVTIADLNPGNAGAATPPAA